MAVTDDYLWNRTGSDDDVERLEKLMAPLAHREAPRARLRPGAVLPFAAAVAAALLIVASIFTPAPASTERRTIDLGAVGSVVVEPHSRVRILKQNDDLVKLRLELGTIHASISAFARPRLFQVETPTTTCVDLGCHYTLTVDRDGRSVVTVTIGQVAFVDGAREVYVPMGASCRAGTRGAGTPAWTDAPDDLLKAVHAFDDRPSAERAREVVARSTQPRDSLTLWHLLADRDAGVAALALDALEKRGAPDGVSRDAVLRRDPAALEAWKSHLARDW